MDETGNGARRGRLDAMVRTAVQAEAARLERRARAVVREHGVPTGHAVPMAHLERLDPPVSPVLLVRRGRPAYLARAVRRVNAVRRATRATRAILGRLAKRANL
jgi:hypothetical protein